MAYLRNIFILLTALLFVSCSQEIGRNTAMIPAGGEIVISATMEEPGCASRTELKDGSAVVWTKGDAIALLTASTNDRFELTSGEGTASAGFSGTPSGNAPYYAFYPYSEECRISDGALEFKLPETQSYVNKGFASGASPSVATMPDLASGAAFKNICGILQVNLCGSGKLQKVEVVDLSGTPLWGDCRLLLDGKQGTSEQTLTVSGGSNHLTIDIGKEISLTASTPKVFNFVVPAGSFSKGFSVKVFDKNGKAVSFLTAQNPAVEVSRSNITTMENVKMPSNGEPLDTLARGYHKDLFMDGGSYLTSRTSLPAMSYLGWKMDYMATEDSVFQGAIVIKSEEDDNGCLLYPDNNPRYRMIYVNGGKGTSHGRSLTNTGRSRYKTFVNHGGAYVGTCAGAFMAAYGTDEGDLNTSFISVYPGPMFKSGLSDAYTGMFIPENSILLDYYDFGGDFYIDSVRHNGGGYITEATLPAGGEILALFDRPDKKMHMNGSVWAYKADEKTGRVVATGSHPEYISSGERRDLFAAMLRYAGDGNGLPSVKGELKNGETREMIYGTLDYRPGFARIGDGQYHHFTVTVPENAKDFKLELQSTEEANLYLTMRKDGIAWMSDADFLLIQKGAEKTLEIPALAPGTWYVGVYCAEEVTVKCGVDKFDCSGNLDALNGIPYNLTASWTE